jgi:hypothetical protein
MPTNYYEKFLRVHKNRLSELCLSDCIVIGHWRDILLELLDSKSLRTMRLHQLGMNFGRVVFPSTCEAFIFGSNEDGWAEVDCLWSSARILPCQNWKMGLGTIIDDLSESTMPVDPAAPDADTWWI